MTRPQLIFIGAPGSGKGTQAKKLESAFGYQHISTGDILRSEIAKGSVLGTRVDSVLKAGRLVDDEMMKELLRANLDFEKNVYILDGYPRTLVQAQTLKEMLGSAPYRAIFFRVDPESLIERLTNRRICTNCGAIYNQKTNPIPKNGACEQCGSKDIVQRNDDKEEIISKRISIYLDHVGPVVDLYRQDGSLYELDAQKDVSELFREIESIL